MRKLRIYPITFELSAETKSIDRYSKSADVEIKWNNTDGEGGDTFRMKLTANKAACLASWLQELSIDLTNGGRKR